MSTCVGERPVRLALTPGEPAGIGPDLAVLAAQRERAVELVVVADPELLRARASQLGLGLELQAFEVAAERPVCRRAGALSYAAEPLAAAVVPGELEPANAPYVLATLRRAAQLCLGGSCEGMVTGPVHKAVLNRNGHSFSGHTEFLAEYTGAGQVVMMLVAGSLRVALATTHLPLSEVSANICSDSLERILRVLVVGLERYFDCATPRIMVCGLNPHAGESGTLGREEIEVIEPCLAMLRAEGLSIEGPVPADTAFTPARLAGVDAVLAMYHDQGLPVLKHSGFGNAINITLGLPILRVSVDHGTALDRAGGHGGAVDEGSLSAAIDTAAVLAHRAR